MKKYFLIGAVLLALVLIPILKNCEGKENQPNPIINQPVAAVQIASPKLNEQYTIGEQLTVELKFNEANLASDIQVSIAGFELEEQDEGVYQLSTNELPVGNLPIVLSFKTKDGKLHEEKRNITLFSDIDPEEQTAIIQNKFTHNVASYTQGLEFHNGQLFESTGQYGTSFIAEVDVNTGQIKRKQDLASTYFGEGLTILDSTIYQITWQAGICKTYDLEFNPKAELNYVGQGWGLTNNGKSIIMSNGSDKIVWRDPQTFQVTKEIQVFNNESSFTQINELELIEGRLFANIYTDDLIVEIDTANGKVLSHIDCSQLVREQPVGVDYLNGIAYNPAGQKIYLTGKLWPTLYEVTFE